MNNNYIIPVGAVNQLFNYLSKGCSCKIIGGKYTGKTELFHALQNEEFFNEQYCRFKSAKGYALDKSKIIVVGIDDEHYYTDISDFFQRILDELINTVKISRSKGARLPLHIPILSQRNIILRLAECLRFLQNNGYEIIIIIDDFHLALHGFNGAAHAYAYLHSFCLRDYGVRLLTFFRGNALLEDCLKDSDLYSALQSVILQPFTKNELIGLGDFSPEVIEAVYDVSGGLPYLLPLAVKAVKNNTHNLSYEVYLSAKPYVNDIINGLSSDAAAYLKILSHEEHALNNEIARKAANELVSSLIYKKEHERYKGSDKFISPIFDYYLQEQRNNTMVLREFAALSDSEEKLIRAYENANEENANAERLKKALEDIYNSVCSNHTSTLELMIKLKKSIEITSEELRIDEEKARSAFQNVLKQTDLIIDNMQSHSQQLSEILGTAEFIREDIANVQIDISEGVSTQNKQLEVIGMGMDAVGGQLSVIQETQELHWQDTANISEAVDNVSAQVGEVISSTDKIGEQLSDVSETMDTINENISAIAHSIESLRDELQGHYATLSSELKKHNIFTSPPNNLQKPEDMDESLWSFLPNEVREEITMAEFFFFELNQVDLFTYTALIHCYAISIELLCKECAFPFYRKILGNAVSDEFSAGSVLFFAVKNDKSRIKTMDVVKQVIREQFGKENSDDQLCRTIYDNFIDYITLFRDARNANAHIGSQGEDGKMRLQETRRTFFATTKYRNLVIRILLQMKELANS